MFEPFFILFGLMAIGYASGKLSWVNETQNQGLGNVLINIAFPCLLFTSIVNVEIQGELLKNFILAGVLSLLFYILFCVLGLVYARLAKFSPELHPMVSLSMFTSNNSFMGFPIVLAFFGQIGFILMVANNIAMALMTFGVGINMLKKARRKWAGQETNGNSSFLEGVKQILNPTIISVALALFGNFTGLGRFVPLPLFEVLSLLGDLTVPLSMIYIGATLSASPIENLLKDKKALGVALSRLIGFSALIFLGLKFLPVSSLIKQILFIVYALPSAAAIPVLTERYGQGQREAVNIVVISTFLSLITAPLGVYIALNFL